MAEERPTGLCPKEDAHTIAALHSLWLSLPEIKNLEKKFHSLENGNPLLLIALHAAIDAITTEGQAGITLIETNQRVLIGEFALEQSSYVKRR